MRPSTIITFFTVLAIWAFTNVDSASHNAAPSPAVDCSSLVLNLVDCLSYVTQGSNVSKPEGSCCSGLKTVLKTDAECLCEAFKNSAQLGVTLNVTKAMTLPSVCHVSAPSISKCGLDNAPGAAPALSPMATSPSSSLAGAPSTGAGAAGIAPTPASSASRSSVLAISFGSFVLTILSVSFSLF